MNNSENIISYISNGESNFLCPFKLESKEELEVLVDNIIMNIDKDYIIVNFGLRDQAVKFQSPIGSVQNYQYVVLQKKSLIVRKTDFFNSTVIKNDLLNLEFDNIINQQQIMVDYLSNMVMIGNNQGHIYLPNYQNGKALIWENKQLVNSKHDINKTLDTLLKYIENNDASSINPPSPPPVAEDIFASDVIYNSNLLPANNVEEALHCLKDPTNIFYSNQNIGSDIINVKLALDNLSTASGISYDNSVTNLEEASSLQNAIDSLYNKFSQEIADIKNNLPTNNSQNIAAVAHSIVNGALSEDGRANHLQYNNSLSLKLVASESEPFIVAFSKNNEIKLVKIRKNLTLKCDTAGIINYIYLDLLSSGDVSLGYKKNKPYYLNYNPMNIIGTNNVHLIDAWQTPSDFFHIPTLTMYSSANVAIDRIYIGQVMFKDDGSISFINNYCHGNVCYQDIKYNSNDYQLHNMFGMENIKGEVYYKYNKIGVEHNYNYSTNAMIIKDDSNRSLKQGFVSRISSDYINFRLSSSATQMLYYYYFSNSTDNPISLSLGYLRFVIKRDF